MFDFSAYSAILLDLDGTLYKSDQPLEGGVDLLRRLASQGKTVACPTNATESPDRLSTRLSGMGIDMPASRIFTAAEAAVNFCLEKFPSRRFYNLATQGVADMLTGRSIVVQDQHEPCDAVIIGNPECVYATPPRLSAGACLLRQGAACIGICNDRAYPSPHGLEIGSGAMTRMLAYAADVNPIFFGKPQKHFLDQICHRLNVSPRNCIMIGDNLDSDIAGAKAAGMATILVLTGVSSRADIPSHGAPDWVVDDLSKL